MLEGNQRMGDMENEERYAFKSAHSEGFNSITIQCRANVNVDRVSKKDTYQKAENV